MANTDVQVTVIGGGVVGRATAWQLSKEGISVRVVDSGEPRFGTSMANAGWVAPSHIIPFAAPGMVSMGIKELVKRSGAFGVSPSAGPSLASWTLKFMRACTMEHVDRNAPALNEILQRSMGLFDDLIVNHGLRRTEKALYYIFSSDRAEELAHEEHDLFTSHGVGTKLVDVESARRDLPILKDNVKAVLELSTDYGIDPRRFVNLLGELNDGAGVDYRTGETVKNVVHRADLVHVTTDKDSWTSDYVVLAAGTWSHEIAKMVGSSLSLIAAKGHSVTLPNMTNMPDRPMMLAEQRLATNPEANGYRLSTGFALTSNNDRSINRKAIDKLYATASEVLHLPPRAANIDPWTGLRPASPDGLPYIGPLANAPRVITATGHGMIGNMLALGTGAVVADIVQERPISAEMLKFSPSRPSA